MANVSQSQNNTKRPSDSTVVMTELVLPEHTNALGTIFGGQVMSWIDIAAAIAAMKHSRQTVVTASIDALHFLAPIKLGYIVHIQASVNFASRTSMEVGVRVESENPLTGEKHKNAKSYVTFVAINAQGKPNPVPPITPETPDEKRRFEQAKIRRESRVKLAEQLKSSPE
jgi:acyl-CoA hydrolase